MQCTTNMDSPKEMLDQKQNWLVSGAYLSHIFRLERHRNHHVETHAQTHPHIQNAKLQPSCSRKMLDINARHAMHNKHGQPKRNARSEAELACIWCLSVTYFQTGAAQKSSHRDLCTNTPAHKHKNALTHKHKNIHNRRTTLYDRL